MVGAGDIDRLIEPVKQILDKKYVIRIVSIVVATLLFCYIVFVSFFFRERRQDKVCQDLQVVVKDSLDKHFVSESDLVHDPQKADLNPIKKPMDEINTDRIETELQKNEMIARVEALQDSFRG